MDIRDFNRPCEDIDNYHLSNHDTINNHHLMNIWDRAYFPAVIAYEVLIQYSSKQAYQGVWDAIQHIKCKAKIEEGVCYHKLTMCSPYWYTKRGLNATRCAALKTLLFILVELLDMPPRFNSTRKIAYMGRIDMYPQCFLMEFVGYCTDVGEVKFEHRQF